VVVLANPVEPDPRVDAETEPAIDVGLETVVRKPALPVRQRVLEGCVSALEQHHGEQQRNAGGKAGKAFGRKRQPQRQHAAPVNAMDDDGIDQEEVEHGEQEAE